MKPILLSLLMLCSSSIGWAKTSEVVLQTIAMESAGEPMAGQVAVASVIINRSRASNRSMEAICLAPKQFSAWNDPKWARRWLDKHYTPKVRETALSALNQAILEPVANIRHYHTTSTKPYWAKGHRPRIIIGHHVFYDDIK